MITIIGDVHGKFNEYYDIVKDREYSICLGDFGFADTWTKLQYSGLSPRNHRINSGNHDDYDTCSQSDHWLGDFGVTSIGDTTFFFIRGGLSIDRVYRVGEELGGGKKSWWSEEELNFARMMECVALYKEIKPDIVLSHVPPGIICDRLHGNKHNILQRFKFHLGFKENTSLLGDALLAIHRPKLWKFGHHHVSYKETYRDTEFQCLEELEICEL